MARDEKKADLATGRAEPREMRHGWPALPLGSYPTSLERLASSGLWIKRDDRSGAVYGGNKVRKLELLLADARARGKSRLVTIGAAGSHQVLATALYGRREGFEVDAVLVAQPGSAHARENLRAALAHGLHPLIASSWAHAPSMLSTCFGRDTYHVPLGGSNALASLGFASAAKELAVQIAGSELPEPDVVVVALGSGGTAAGLAVGFEEVGLRTKVVGVVIAPPVALVSGMARRLVRKTAALAGLSPEAAQRALHRLAIDDRWLGRGYGYATTAGEAAAARAALDGIALDPTYTSKAFACALELAQRGEGVVLYWHTLSSAPMTPLLAGAPELPPELGALFR